MIHKIARRWLVRMGAGTLALACQALLGSGVAWSQNQPFQGTTSATLMQYFDTTQADNFVRTLNAADFPLCAMIYVYDAAENLQACCGCELTGDGPDFQTVKLHLVPNSSSGSPPAIGAIKILSTLPNHASTASSPPGPETNDNTVCDPTSSATLLDGLRAWILHAPGETPRGGGTTLTNLTQPEFDRAPLTQADFNPALRGSILNRCAFIQNHQSGRGICSCGLQDNTLNAID